MRRRIKQQKHRNDTDDTENHDTTVLQMIKKGDKSMSMLKRHIRGIKKAQTELQRWKRQFWGKIYWMGLTVEHKAEGNTSEFEDTVIEKWNQMKPRRKKKKPQWVMGYGTIWNSLIYDVISKDKKGNQKYLWKSNGQKIQSLTKTTNL